VARTPLGALRRVLAQLLTSLLSRGEFAALELAQARAQLVRWLLLALVAMTFFELAVLAASGALAVALWDRFGPAALIVLAVVSAGVAAAILRRLRREIAETPPLFSETLAELAKDRSALLDDEDSAPRQDSAPSARQRAAPEGPGSKEASL